MEWKNDKYSFLVFCKHEQPFSMYTYMIHGGNLDFHLKPVLSRSQPERYFHLGSKLKLYDTWRKSWQSLKEPSPKVDQTGIFMVIFGLQKHYFFSFNVRIKILQLTPYEIFMRCILKSKELLPFFIQHKN